ncbi:MAG: alpha/beta fold hydrolase, partial [Chloroflexales bacterium]|nr:alpha/beta fold hydrolase [Chloroflexales bacterium]
STTTPPPAPTVAASTPTAVALAAPTASIAAPTASPEPPPTTAPPTSTPAPPTPTVDPYAELAPLTIDGLRARSFGQGSIEIVRELERTPAFTRYLFAYASDGLRITGMLNQPNGAGPFPPVILNHGYYPLDAYETGNGTLRAADYLAARGFLTLAPDFRSHAASDDAPNVFRAGHVIDTLNLIPLAQRLPAALPGKVLLWGHSNGGAVAAKVIAVSDQVAAALIYAPASLNIVEDYRFRQERWARRAGQPPGRRQGVVDRLEIEFPLTPEQAPDLYSRLSPLGYARYVSARVQIIWGDQDETVPRKWPEDLYTALRDAGADVNFAVYPGQPHSFDAAGNAAYLPQMAQFFNESLGP